jgi:hypothetical protein
MISAIQILRLAGSNEYRRLVERLLSNGRCHSSLAMSVLRNAETAAAAGLGLALQRLCELAYWPHPDGAALAQKLVRLQRRDGLFGHGLARDTDVIAASAIALRGLIDWASQFPPDDNRLALVRQSIDRAWRAIAAQSTDAKDEREWNEVTWAIVLWQLGECDEARARLPIRQIRSRITSASAALLADDLSRLALTMAA